jgi:Ca-activated chloride channel family protein
MDDTDFNQLARLPEATPSPDARARAIEAAMLSFDAEFEKSGSPAQGTAAASRLISVLTHHAWRWIMEKRVIVGAVAATVLIAPIAVQLGWQNREPLRGFLGGNAEMRIANEPVPLGRTAGTGAAPPRPEPAPPAARAEVAPSAPPAPLAATEAAGAGRADGDVGRMAAMPYPASPSPQMSLGGQYQPSVPAYRQAFDKRAFRGTASVTGPVGAPSLTYDPPPPASAENRGNFEKFDSNPLKLVANEPVSTFSIDVDTASYAFVRRMIDQGTLPPADAVRVEEMINYFPYDYSRPDSAEVPFRTSVAVYPTPWNPQTKLVHIGIKGYDIVPAERPRSNLVFLVDVSGSMASTDKLPLLKNAFRLLVDQLGADDTVSIVTYAGQAGTALEPTKASDRQKILDALSHLEAGGSTAGEQGIRQAYTLAERAFIKDGVNRVMLATDGDFNVGISDIGELQRYIETKRRSGIFLSVLGFGQGNYNDALMQALAQNGNGNAAYIDTLSEARKVLVEEAGSTLFPIAKDVKIQVEFNPAAVSEYRLIGYETRALRREDFNNDRVDAGDIGSGHTVTALYEITPRDSTARMVDDLRYKPATDAVFGGSPDEYAFLKLRYKLPSQENSKLITVPVTKDLDVADVASLGTDMRFAAAVAAFGQKLRGDTRLDGYGYDRILDLARSSRGDDRFGYRGEFLNMVQLAGALSDIDRR